MRIQFTRAIVHAILDGKLTHSAANPDPIFGIGIPASCPGVPSEILFPRSTWADPAAYDQRARDLARSFQENFKQFASGLEPAVIAAGPKVL